MDEKSLISAVKNGSESAFKEIYDAYWQRVFLFASLYITDKDEVRDIYSSLRAIMFSTSRGVCISITIFINRPSIMRWNIPIG